MLVRCQAYLRDELPKLEFVLFIGPVSSVFDYTTFFVMLEQPGSEPDRPFFTEKHRQMGERGRFIDNLAAIEDLSSSVAEPAGTDR